MNTARHRIPSGCERERVEEAPLAHARSHTSIHPLVSANSSYRNSTIQTILQEVTEETEDHAFWYKSLLEFRLLNRR